MAVRREGYCLSSARRAWRNCRIELGWAEEGGYSAGEMREGMTRRWMVCDGVEASCRCMFSSIAVKGDAELDVGRGMGI